MEIVDSVGVARYKTTGWHELLTMLDHSIVVEKLKESRVYDVDIPRMPKDVLLTSTRLFDNGQAQVKVTGFVKGIEYPFLYQERSYMIQIPNIVYRATWQKRGEGDGKLLSLSLATTTSDEPTEETELYRWPFSNVYSNGKVCWSVQNVQCRLHEIVDKGVFGFIQTPNNRDLFGTGSSQNSPHRAYEGFLAAIEEAHGVPQEWLIPFGKTVAEFHQ